MHCTAADDVLHDCSWHCGVCLGTHAPILEPARGRSTRFVGVSRDKRAKKWRALFGSKDIGCFDSEEDAAHAWDDVARSCRGASAHGGRSGRHVYRLNFPTVRKSLSVCTIWQGRLGTESRKLAADSN